MSPNEILNEVTQSIPRETTGVERQKAVGDLVAALPPPSRECLRGTVDELLSRMSAGGASDLDMGGEGCQGQVWYRVQGEKKPDPEAGAFSKDETDAMLHSLLTVGQREHLLSRRNLDFSYCVGSNGHASRYRADLYFDLSHLALNMRHIPDQIRPFKTLELHPNAARAVMLAYEQSGLSLVTGVTGSGKSATLDTIIDANNQTAHAHIVVIGSPIETVHVSKKSIVRHREVGKDVLSFKDGAVQALRQDPDIIAIGEMRDPETIVTALEVADSGHKVFSTLHTASAVESVDRIIGECPSAEQDRIRERLGDVLRCIISQKLVPGLDGRLVLAKEVLLATPSVRAAIKNNTTGEIYQMMYEGQALGMNTLEQDLKRLAEQGLISTKTAVGSANNKRRMEELL